jgi:preprotein translocase subunit Sss1
MSNLVIGMFLLSLINLIMIGIVGFILRVDIESKIDEVLKILKEQEEK